MHPVLFTLPVGPGFPIHVYGVMGAMGFLAALIFINREAPRHGLTPETTTNLAVGAVLSGLVGSRVLFILLNWDIFRGDLGLMLNLRDGGLVFLGGLLGALGFSVAYVRARGLAFLTLADLFVPSLALAQGLGRIGCLAAGCCYGRPTDLPVGITFDPTSVGPLDPGVHYHPVQAYESATWILLFVALAWMLRHRRVPGQVFLAYLLCYGALRFLLELIRGDAERGFVLETVLGAGVLSTSQAISLAMIAAGVLAWRPVARAGAAPSVGVT